MNKKTSAVVGFEKHNHGACTENAINSAEKYCIKNNIKLTPIRKKVLELLLQEHRALGAYAILAMLREQGFSNQPPVAYRALDFLVEHGSSPSYSITTTDKFSFVAVSPIVIT